MGCRSVRPQDGIQFFNPEVFGFIQSGLQSMQNDSVGYFDLAVGLWMPDRGQPVRDMKSRTELSEVSVVELSSIVGDNSVW